MTLYRIKKISNNFPYLKLYNEQMCQIIYVICLCYNYLAVIMKNGLAC